MKVAAVHEWLDTYAGSERVLEEILAMYPQADVFVMVDFLPAAQRAFLRGRRVTTSFIQHLPFARKRFRWYLPLMPFAVEQFDLSGYDLIISSSHAVAKGVIGRPHQPHISYVHSPMRYAWDLQGNYLAGGKWRSLVPRLLMHYLRMWDSRTANGVDQFIANSGFIAQRILKTYRRTADVIHPPVDTADFTVVADKEDFYVTLSRLVPYKRVDLLVDAFAQMPDRGWWWSATALNSRRSRLAHPPMSLSRAGCPTSKSANICSAPRRSCMPAKRISASCWSRRRLAAPPSSPSDAAARPRSSCMARPVCYSTNKSRGAGRSDRPVRADADVSAAAHRNQCEPFQRRALPQRVPCGRRSRNAAAASYRGAKHSQRRGQSSASRAGRQQRFNARLISVSSHA